ncbi:Uncharacterised protein [uncultured archaeon]|nr:Uncharacterised protein [uncultured archaeon]
MELIEVVRLVVAADRIDPMRRKRLENTIGEHFIPVNPKVAMAIARKSKKRGPRDRKTKT